MTILQYKIINPHARLATLASGLRSNTLDTQARQQLAGMLERIAEGEDAGLGLGLKGRRGQRLWHTCAALAERDRLLCEAAARFFPDLSKAEQARHLHIALLRYASTAWLRERTLDQC